MYLLKCISLLYFLMKDQPTEYLNSCFFDCINYCLGLFVFSPIVYGPALLEHCLLKASLQPNSKAFKSDNEEGERIKELKTWNEILFIVLMSDNPRNNWSKLKMINFLFLIDMDKLMVALKNAQNLFQDIDQNTKVSRQVIDQVLFSSF